VAKTPPFIGKWHLFDLAGVVSDGNEVTPLLFVRDYFEGATKPELATWIVGSMSDRAAMMRR
jgi:hypothetical protein